MTRNKLDLYLFTAFYKTLWDTRSKKILELMLIYAPPLTPYHKHRYFLNTLSGDQATFFDSSPLARSVDL